MALFFARADDSSHSIRHLLGHFKIVGNPFMKMDAYDSIADVPLRSLGFKQAMN
ncbi:hypothetical protein Poly24_47780 [Rosistilla carotiformis]|uniref:Uncharacterized protein n=1 Tax=Rosistilla carotiformis TaxID=2528017 RepID=A0A518JZZ4_9BACT|nr:hypothetical protein Poly24_47780 [Rosistilla carotiformis]